MGKHTKGVSIGLVGGEQFPNKDDLFQYYEDTWLNGQFPMDGTAK